MLRKAPRMGLGRPGNGIEADGCGYRQVRQLGEADVGRSAALAGLASAVQRLTPAGAGWPGSP